MRLRLWAAMVVALPVITLCACSRDESPSAPGMSSGSEHLVTFTSMGPLARPVGSDGEIVPGEYIVVLNSKPDRARRDALHREALSVASGARITPRHTYGRVLCGFAARFDEETRGRLARDPLVAWIEPNRTVHVDAQTVPWGITRARAVLAHARGFRGAGVRVGVLDTGIAYNHFDLAANYAGGTNIVAGTDDPMDDHGHGTHVAGIIAAVDNSLGVIGVAPACRLYGIKVLGATGTGTFADVISGIDWAVDNGMQVINLSLSSSAGSTAMQTACDNAAAAGVVICAAAGNNGGPVGYPAAYASCIAVSATDQNDALYTLSNRGAAIDVAAPGVGVYSTWLGSGYSTMDGTSMAAPHVAGVCALILSSGIATTAAGVKERLFATCADIGAAGLDTSFGRGLVDANAATGGPAAGANEPPVAAVNGPYPGTLTLPVSFSATGSTDPDGAIASYLWSFGDGGSSTLPAPTHAYYQAGTYTVTLTVTDDDGAGASASTTASITASRNTDVVTVLRADYTASPPLLLVRAVSSRQPGVTLTVTGYGTMTWKPKGLYYELTSNFRPGPTSVTVTSSKGGKATVAVVVR